jgi:hypothetical protein
MIYLSIPYTGTEKLSYAVVSGYKTYIVAPEGWENFTGICRELEKLAVKAFWSRLSTGCFTLRE